MYPSRLSLAPAMITLAVIFLGLALVGCGGGPTDEAAPPEATAEPEAAASADPDSTAEEPTADAPGDILPHPFTAEQIRDAMPAGLVVELLNTTPGGDQRQRWTVQSADEEGMTMLYSNLTGEGELTQSSTWVELRNHATFSVETAKRERTTQTTELGELEGWLYTIEDPTAGAVTEMFFADDYPGAPVQMTTQQGETVVMSMKQLSRQLPTE